MWPGKRSVTDRPVAGHSRSTDDCLVSTGCRLIRASPNRVYDQQETTTRLYSLHLYEASFLASTLLLVFPFRFQSWTLYLYPPFADGQYLAGFQQGWVHFYVSTFIRFDLSFVPQFVSGHFITVPIVIPLSFSCNQNVFLLHFSDLFLTRVASRDLKINWEPYSAIHFYLALLPLNVLSGKKVPLQGKDGWSQWDYLSACVKMLRFWKTRKCRL